MEGVNKLKLMVKVLHIRAYLLIAGYDSKVNRGSRELRSVYILKASMDKGYRTKDMGSPCVSLVCVRVA